MARQLQKPTGLLGYIAGQWMNRFNRQMTTYAVERLSIEPQHAVLDIGFGGGEALKLMGQRAYKGLVVGIDISDTMLRHAQRTYATWITQGRIRVGKGSVESIPFASDSFDRICTINTVYFWNELSGAAHEVHRALKPGGLIVIAFRPRSDMSTLEIVRYGFKLYDSPAIVQALESAGFIDLTIEEGCDAHLCYLLVGAMKRGTKSDALAG